VGNGLDAGAETVEGTKLPESAARAGKLGLPMALGIIGGMLEQFAPFVELHRTRSRAGRPRAAAAQYQLARLHRRDARAGGGGRIPALRADDEPDWPRARLAPMQRQDFDAAMTLRGANFVGSPQDVIDKILFQHEIFQHDRFLLQITVGAMPHDKVMRSI